jgi:hypothetical protein
MKNGVLFLLGFLALPALADVIATGWAGTEQTVSTTSWTTVVSVSSTSPSGSAAVVANWRVYNCGGGYQARILVDGTQEIWSSEISSFSLSDSSGMGTIATWMDGTHSYQLQVKMAAASTSCKFSKISLVITD